jgi:hypothetical protein
MLKKELTNFEKCGRSVKNGEKYCPTFLKIIATF